MTSLKIELANPTDVQLLIAFAERLNAKVTKLNGDTEFTPTYWLEQLASINAFSSIEDPVQWQRKSRKDRNLPMR
ncbi:MAG: hypothetical protein AB8G22_01930 [Saprospiraceae bacterium]